MSLEQLLTDTATVKRLNRNTSDGMGGFTDGGWEDIAYVFLQPSFISGPYPYTVDIRISPLSARERERYQQQQFPVTHKGYVRGYMDIKAEDRLFIGDRVFDVKGVTNPSEANHHLEVLVQELT